MNKKTDVILRKFTPVQQLNIVLKIINSETEIKSLNFMFLSEYLVVVEIL